MSKNLDQIEAVIPEAAKQDHIKALAEDLDKAQLLRNVLESEGGELMLNSIRNDCKDILGKILKQVEHPLVAKLEAHLNFLTTLQTSKDREKSLQQILDEELRAITNS